MPPITERPSTLTDEQQTRAEALRVAANVLGGRPMFSGQGALPNGRDLDDLLDVAQWLLDGSRDPQVELLTAEPSEDVLDLREPRTSTFTFTAPSVRTALDGIVADIAEQAGQPPEAVEASVQRAMDDVLEPPVRLGKTSIMLGVPISYVSTPQELIVVGRDDLRNVLDVLDPHLDDDAPQLMHSRVARLRQAVQS